MPSLFPTPSQDQQDLLVHFGTFKTGTSSIQQTLYRAEALPEAIRYMAFGMANSSLMIQSLFSAERRAQGDRLRHMTDMWNRERDRVRSAHRAILSAETIGHLTADELKPMLAQLGEFGARLRFVGYVRDPVSYTRSAFQERLKVILAPHFPLQDGPHLRKTYHEIVDRLDDLVGAERVAVSPFDRSLFPGGDVVRHFLDLAGIPESSVTIQRANDSLSQTAIKALYSYRRLLQRQDAAIGSDRTRDDFVGQLAELPGPPLRLAPEIAARIAAANRHIFDWAERRLGRAFPMADESAPDGVRSEADMMTFDDAELPAIDDWATRLGHVGLPARLDTSSRAAAVADLLHDLRLRAAAARP